MKEYYIEFEIIERAIYEWDIQTYTKHSILLPTNCILKIQDLINEKLKIGIDCIIINNVIPWK